jgi:hypothetical protein
MKTITVGNKAIAVSHESVVDSNNHQLAIHCKFEADGKTITHVLTVGSSESVATGLDAATLQADLDAFKQKHAEQFASKLHAIDLANALTE